MNRLQALGFVPTEKGMRSQLGNVLKLFMGSDDHETRSVLNNFIRSSLGKGDLGFGRRGGTPPRRKTKWRLEIQAAKGCTGAAKRLIKFDAANRKFYAGGHPTKKHTAGRVEMYA
jgi:hypothetical protein